MKALIDADALCFRMAVVVEEVNPFTGEVESADLGEAFNLCKMRLAEVEQVLFDEFQEDVDIELHFSDKTNYRYRVEPSYKSNRKGSSKPVIYKELVDKCKRLYDWVEYTDIEADDSMGACQDKFAGVTCIVSPDKDLRQIAGYHLNLNKLVEGVEEVTAEQGHKFFMTQCIAGDTCDGYHGATGFGMKKAKDWLETYGYTWDSIVKAYESCKSPKTKRTKMPNGKYKTKRLVVRNLGLGEAEALKTARMAFILNDWKYYDKATNEVRLWEPSDV